MVTSSNRAWHKILCLLAVTFVLPQWAAGLTITEIMYNPPGADEALQYIEIHNELKDPFDITGFYFSSGITFRFDQRKIMRPKEYIVIAADADRVRAFYDISVYGAWLASTSLDNGGERITISNASGVVQTTVRYNDRGKWPAGADGTGHSLEIEDVFGEQDDPDNWSISRERFGTPGKANRVSDDKIPVEINEGFFFTANSADRWIELYNDSLEEVDISGYHITTQRSNLTEFKIPEGTKIGPRKHLVFNGADLGVSFDPDDGNRIFTAITTPDGEAVVNAYIFAPRLEGMSESRIPDGSKDWQDAADMTPGQVNSTSAPTSIVINEISYHSIQNDRNREFIELYNRGTEEVDLSGWVFNEGIRYTIPQGTMLGADKYLVIAFNPEFIRETYELDASQVIGPQTEEAIEAFGTLANGGERIVLVDQLTRIADQVRYHDGGEWPIWADAHGSTLELIDPKQDNSFASAWDASDDSAKAEVTEISYQGQFYSAGEQEFHLVLNSEGMAMVDNINMFSRVVALEVLEEVVPFGGEWKYFVGTEQPGGDLTSWRQSDFDDADWRSGPAPIGYSRRWEDGVGTFLEEEVKGIATSYFLRRDYDLGDISRLSSLILEADFDDGFALFVNGEQVALVNMNQNELTHDSVSSASASSALAEVDLTEHLGKAIKSGVNKFAVQVHNRFLNSNDMLFDMRLVDGRYVNTDGDNLIVDGDFEDSQAGAAPRYPRNGTLRNWTIEGNHIRSGRTDKGALAGTHSLKIVASGRGDNKVNRIETSNSGLSGLQARTNYSISLLAKWIIGSPVLLTHGAYNSPGGTPNYAASHQLKVPAKLGSPGMINTVTERLSDQARTVNMGPVITKVRQAHALPPEGTPQVIRARVSDSDGVTKVTLHFVINNAADENDRPNSVVMTDPDGDGTYEGTIPAQARRANVLYWIVAEDTLSNSERFPVDNLARTHPLVLDPEIAYKADRNFLMYRHDARAPATNLSYRFWMNKDDENYLSSRRLLSNDLLKGAFVFENERIYQGARARFSGSPWARQGWGGSFRVNLPKDDQLKGRVKKFNMEDHQGSGARDPRERMSHYLIRHIGAGYYSDQWLVRFQVNDRLNDLREHVQTPSREFLSLWAPGDSDGPFFEMDDRFNINDAGSRSGQSDGVLQYPPYNQATGGEDKETYRYFFTSRGGNPTDNYRELIDFAKVLSPNVTNNPAFDDVIEDMANIEEMMGVWAIRMNTDDWDTWGTNRGKNCYIYYPPIDGRWVLIPWDCELTYGNAGAFMPPSINANASPDWRPSGKFPEVNRFINRPRVKRVLYGIMNDMIQPGAAFTRNFLQPYSTELQRIGMGAGNVVNFVANRANSLATRVRGVNRTSIQFSITTNGGNDFDSEEPVVMIEGRAPVEVRTISIMVNGKEAVGGDAQAIFSDASVVGWEAEVALSGGVNAVEFIAFDANGDMFGSDTITITSQSKLFIRGDANLSGKIDIGDVIDIFRHVGHGYVPSCIDACDADDSGDISITDGIQVITYLFLKGDPLPDPFGTRGEDPTPDDLGCEVGL